jgi:hypothetical protein
MIQVAVFVIDFDMASLSPLVQGRAGLGPIHLKGVRSISAPAGSHSKAYALTMARRRQTDERGLRAC